MFFERRCPICADAAPAVCDPCWSSLAPARPRWIASPGADGARDLEVRSLYAYGPEAAAVILAAKNGGRRPILRRLAQEMAAQLGGASVGVVTWVPASPRNRRERGFDQGRVMARCLAAALGVPVRGLLAHELRASTGPKGAGHLGIGQKGKSRIERQAGANLVATRPVRGPVLLIDDVITTGASLRHGADALYLAGAAHVLAMTAASADREK